MRRTTTKTGTGKPSAATDKQPHKNNLPGKPRRYWLSGVPPEGRTAETPPPKANLSRQSRDFQTDGEPSSARNRTALTFKLRGWPITNRDRSPESSITAGHKENAYRPVPLECRVRAYRTAFHQTTIPRSLWQWPCIHGTAHIACFRGTFAVLPVCLSRSPATRCI